MPAKEITTLGFLLEPRVDEHWGMEFEGAKQFGRTLNGNRQTGGWMAHGDYYDSSKPAYFIRWEVSFKF